MAEAQARAAPPDGGGAWARARLVLIIGALSAFGPLSIDMYLPALPSMAHDLAGAAWQVQLTLTGCLLGLAGGQLVAGPLSDRLGRRRPLVAGVGVYAAASLACAFAPSVPVLVALRLVQGAAGAAGIVISRAVVRDLHEGHALAQFLALTMVVNGLAPILAPIIGAQILHLTTWRGVFLVLAAIGAGLCAMAALGLPETLPAQRRRTGGVGVTLGVFRRLASDRVFLGYALAGSLAFAAMFTYISGSPFVLQERYGISPQLFSFIFATNAFGIMVNSQISAGLVKRVGARRLLAAGLAASICGGALLLADAVAGWGLAGILPGFFLVVASIGLIAPNTTALALQEHAQEAGSASALLGLGQYVVGGLVAPLAGSGGAGALLPVAVIMAVCSVGAGWAFGTLTRARRG